MNIFAIIFLLVDTAALLLLPRRWVPLPLLAGVCYMTVGQSIELGPFTFTVIRILAAAGLLRAIIRGERLAGGMNAMDWLMVAWAVWALVSSILHDEFTNALISRLGLVYNACGIYFLLRTFCQSLDDVVLMARIVAILLIPVAVEMLIEQLTGHNLFSVLGRVHEISTIRVGRFRAQGPFAHPILAGTVGAVGIPLMIGLWHRHRREAIAGIFACLVMVFTSASSGPIISTTVGIGALMMWLFRHRMRLVQWLAVSGYVGLDLLMEDPAYFLIARIDLTGGSTGWHRARLIESAFEHLSEWWLAGTDYTRHWMPTGVTWSAEHTDITNHYLQMGVLGGLPLMLLFIAVIVKGFSFVGQALQQTDDQAKEYQFMIWALGASLFAHAVTFIAVSYYDQSFLFIYLPLALIGSAWSSTVMFREESEDIEPAEMQQIQS